MKRIFKITSNPDSFYFFFLSTNFWDIHLPHKRLHLYAIFFKKSVNQGVPKSMTLSMFFSGKTLSEFVYGYYSPNNKNQRNNIVLLIVNTKYFFWASILQYTIHTVSLNAD